MVSLKKKKYKLKCSTELSSRQQFAVVCSHLQLCLELGMEAHSLICKTVEVKLCM